MTENEAAEALRFINTSRVHPFYTCKEMTAVRDVAIQALKEIQIYRKIGTVEECREAVEKQKPKHVNIKDWSPARCPFCNYELSTSLGDGYYQHPTFLERCPKCGQSIRWDNNLEGMEDERD